MPARNQQTHAKRARELAVKEKRERKRQKKADRAAGILPDENGHDENGHGENVQGENVQSENVQVETAASPTAEEAGTE